MILAMREAREARTAELEQRTQDRKVERAELKRRRDWGLIRRHATKTARNVAAQRPLEC